MMMISQLIVNKMFFLKAQIMRMKPIQFSDLNLYLQIYKVSHITVL